MTPADRIRDLCAQAVAAENDDEALNGIIPQLREALHELRLMVATDYPFHQDVAAD